MTNNNDYDDPPCITSQCRKSKYRGRTVELTTHMYLPLCIENNTFWNNEGIALHLAASPYR